MVTGAPLAHQASAATVHSLEPSLEGPLLPAGPDVDVVGMLTANGGHEADAVLAAIRGVAEPLDHARGTACLPELAPHLDLGERIPRRRRVHPKDDLGEVIDLDPVRL